MMRDWIAHRVAATPDRPALVDAPSGRTWTYAELDDLVETYAGRLAGLGLGPGDHLGTLLETCPAHVALVHAAMRLGARFVPLHGRLDRDALSDQAAAADLDALVCGAGNAADAAALGVEPVVSVDGTGDEGDGSVVALDAVAAAPVDGARWGPDDTQAMCFTSGTTGEPKVVRLTTGNLLASAAASAVRIGVLPDDRWFDPLPMDHLGGLAPVTRCALYGTAVVVQPAFEAGAALEAAHEHGVTGVSLVPTMLTRLLDAGVLPPSLRFVLLGGAPATPDLINRCRERGVPVHPTYGMTETASQIATATPAEAFAEPDTVGRPLLFTDVTVLVADGSPAPAGEVGELVVSGPTVSPGYYGDPDATAASRGPYGLRTGDVGRLDASGRLFVLDRRDDLIVTGGENVRPGAIAAVLREHPAVADAAVIGLPDPEWGERVAALVVTGGGRTLDRADLEAFCRERLAGHELPRTIAIADDLPRTGSGTVDRAAVRDRLRREG